MPVVVTNCHFHDVFTLKIKILLPTIPIQSKDYLK